MKRIKKILCVVEPSQSSEAALIQTLRLAEDQQADVTFASVVTPPKNLLKIFKKQVEIAQLVSDEVVKIRSSVEKWVKQHTQKERSSIQIFSGIGFIEIIKYVVEQKYDLVVKCADDADWLDRLFGSDDMHLLRKCPCPVLMLKPNQSKEFQHVLATVDVNEELDEEINRVQSELNEKVLEYSAVFSLSDLTTFHVGSAFEFYGENFLRYSTFSSVPDEKVDQYVRETRRECEGKLESLMRKMRSFVGEEAVNHLRPKVHLVKGQPSKEIPMMVKEYDIDLIVMGTVARTGIPGFIIGNTAESILEQVQCSVLAVKPDGFVSPITK